jgi:hypothetical protein
MFNVVDLNEDALLAMHHMQNSEFANVGAGVGGGFKNTKELKIMNYEEEVYGPDGVRWQAKFENKFQRMVTHKVFEVVLRTGHFPEGSVLLLLKCLYGLKLSRQ